MPHRPQTIVAIGASAGGVPALCDVVAGLPQDLDAAVFVVLHIPPHTPSRLTAILQRATPLSVVEAKDAHPLHAGCIYVASADHHLMVGREEARVTRGPRESRARPSIDVLFRSAAVAFGPRAIGVVLTGMLDDGTAGLWAVKDRGGRALVQDPATAEYRSMPESAIAHVDVDAVLPAAELGKEIARWVREISTMEDTPLPQRMNIENSIASEDYAMEAGVMQLGKVSAYTCPDCHGALVQIEEGKVVRFRCHTGHGFSVKALLDGVNESIDKGLWNTMRAIEERVMLLRHMATLAHTAGDRSGAASLETQAAAAQARVEPIRELVLGPAWFDQDPNNY